MTDKTTITDQREKAHAPKAITPLNAVSGGVDLFIHDCECGAWRIKLNGRTHDWKQPTSPTGRLTVEEAAKVVDGLPEGPDGYGTTIALAVHHNGLVPKNDRSELCFGEEIMNGLSESGLDPQLLDAELLALIYYQARRWPYHVDL